MDIICEKIANAMIYAYHRGRFWRWDPSRSVWKESHLMTAKFQRAKAALRTLTPESFFSDSGEFALLDDYEISLDMTEALANAKPCQSAPVDPVEETPDIPDTPDPAGDPLPAPAAPEGTSPVTETDSAVPSTISAPAFESPAAPGFDFGADEQTNALLLQDAQTFITGNMARIMAAKHAHDLTASHYKGSWGKWCAAVGISRDTGENMVRVAEQFGNIQLEGRSILDVQPLKLLYAAAKPSTPTQVKQAVFSGDITTYKEYQELMEQVKAERSRADAAQSHLDAALADVQGLTEQNHQLQQRAEAAETREEEAWSLREKLKTENEALKRQPITAVVDEEEIERRVGDRVWRTAADMTDQLRKEKDAARRDNAALKKQLAAVQAQLSDTIQLNFEGADSCVRLIRAAWESCRSSFAALTGEDLDHAVDRLNAALNSIMRESISLLTGAAPEEEQEEDTDDEQ